MSDQRRWQLDLFAGLLLLAGLLLSLSVFTHDPAGNGTVYPPESEPRNFLGPVGAWVGETLLATFGIAVHVFLASWLVLVLMLFLRRRWITWLLRLFGWLVLVPCCAVLAHYWNLWHAPAVLTGPGGSLGALLALYLADTFRPLGRGLVLGSALVLGLFLAVDFVLQPLLRWTWRLTAGALRLLVRLVRRSDRPLSVKRHTPAGTTTTDTPTTAHPGTDPAGEEDRTIPIHHHDAINVPELVSTNNSNQPPRNPVLSTTPGFAAGTVSLVKTPTPQSEAERFADYKLPPLSLLEDSKPLAVADLDQQLRDRAALLEQTFADFGLKVRVVGINTGPVVTQFEIALETGLRVHKVTSLADDLALNLKVSGIRMVAPIPGKNTVGIEVPNEVRADVRLKEVILASAKKIAKSKLPLFLGKDSEGRPLVYDLADMPHLLIAGSTGTGKSVCLNAVILSTLLTRRPDEVKMVMIDPKFLEMSEFGKIPHLMHPVVTDMKKAEAILAWAVDKMEERYQLLALARVRNIAAFNELKPDEIRRRLDALAQDGLEVPLHLPYIVIFIDEMADLMMQMKKEVEGHIIRLAQKSRAAGIHLVVATQKPTVDVITGLIKSNLPARICFKVVNKSDSRVVLDAMGGDKLLGRGDMLVLPPGSSDLVRAQGTYASDQEIARVVEYIESDPCYAQELMQLKTREQEEAGEAGPGRLKDRDPMYQSAIEVIVREGRGSVSLLQRTLGIGYGRAARLVDFMAEDGIVGTYNGSNAREVLLSPEQWAAMRGGAIQTEANE